MPASTLICEGPLPVRRSPPAAARTPPAPSCARLVLLLPLAVTPACGRSPDPIRAALGPTPAADPNAEAQTGHFLSGTELRMLTSTDEGAHWSLSPDVIAHGVSSLHACTYEDTVWVPCLLDVREISWMESAFPVPFVDVLRSRDLVHWTADRIRVRADTKGAIDPACVVGPEGLEMWFAEMVGSDGDPAQGDKPANIWRSAWREDQFDDAEVAHQGQGLVDPAPTYADGALRLFLNQDGNRIVELLEGRLISAWGQATVPQVAELGDRRWLLAQEPRGQGMLPVARALGQAGTPGGALGPSFPIEIDGLLRSCESPSMTTLDGKWLLFCVDASARPQEHGQGQGQGNRGRPPH